MKKVFEALGGLLEIRLTTGNNLDDLNDEELEILQKELDNIQNEINKIRPKEEKTKNPKDILNDKDIPYEVRMKYIIDAYRKDQVKWGKLAAYAKHLEGEVIRLKEVMIQNGITDNAVIGDYEPNKDIKELRAKVSKLEAEKNMLLKYHNNINVTDLENTISTYPLKIYKAYCFKSIIDSQKEYIEELQELLTKNDIPFSLRLQVNDLEKDGVDHIVEEAGKYLRMNKKVIEDILTKWKSISNENK